jgi:16S rRNA (guanine(966)-N(2))-methyltransferase RsmD
MPRIISGTAKGMPLKAPAGDKTRPTSDKTKEAMFSILANRIPGSVFLDLYGGSGQIGLEAASRGAAEVYIVEQSASGQKVIRSNIVKTRLQESVGLFSGTAASQIRLFIKQGIVFDIIFLDPPWQQAIVDFKKLASDLAELSDENSIIVLEHDAKQNPPHDVTKLQWSRSCQYGSAMLSFYRKLNEQDRNNQLPEAEN